MIRATAFGLGQVIIDQACLDRMGDIGLVPCVCVCVRVRVRVRVWARARAHARACMCVHKNGTPYI